MRAAKLFAALAILQLGLALFEGRRTRPSIDIYFHGTYFVVARAHWFELMAVTSALFALVYVAASRWVVHPLNSSLGLTHFVFALTGFVFLSNAFFTIGSEMANGLPAGRAVYHWVFLAFSAGSFCFLLGCATLAVNCLCTGISFFRTR